MNKKNIKVNAILNMIKTISSIIFPLITFPYVSRVLMPENIGKVNFGSSFVSYFSLIASLGISTYAIRECSAKRDDKNELSKTASQIFSINIVTTIIAYALMVITLLLFRSFDSYRTLIIIQSTTILFTTLGCDWLNSAMEDFAFITVRTVIFQIVSLVLMFVLIHKPSDYLKYAIISVIASSGANLVNILYRKRYCYVGLVKEIEWKKHFKPIALLFVMLLAQTIFNSSDTTMLGLMKGDTEVGYYSVAVKMSNLISQVVASLAWVVMPRMSLYFEQNNYDKINEMLKKTLEVLITIGLPCAVGCICLSQEIVVIVSGEQYIAASPVLNILMISFMISLVGGSFLGNMVLLPSKREDIYMMACCIAAAVNLVMNYFTIPLWGANAAAFTTAFASLLIMVFLIISKDKRVKLDYVGRILLAPALGCVLIVISCLFIKSLISNLITRTVLCIFVSVIAYFTVQIMCKNGIVLDFFDTIKKKFK